MIRKVIAGVAFLIENDSDFVIDENHPIAKAFYLTENQCPSDHQIHIRIGNDRMPVFTHGTSLFYGNNGWYIYKDEAFYWIVLHPAGDKDPLWMVRMDHLFSAGLVYYGERLKGDQNDSSVFFDPVAYPLDQILMMHYLARIGGMIIHSAGWCWKDSGWIFAGKSGAGKSTISNLIVAETGTPFLSDDRMAVRNIDGDFFMYGTPWPGDAGFAVNESVPLKGIFFLNQGTQNNIKQLNPSEAIARLMPVASIPWYDREKVVLLMELCDALIDRIPMVELTFVPDRSAVELLLSFIDESVFLNRS